MKDIMADYVKLPELEEYREWFKDHFDLYREDGILQVTMKTNDRPMCWSGANHRAMSQLSRIISLDRKNEILIWTHKVITARPDVSASAADVLDEPVLVCRASGTCVVPKNCKRK